MGSNSYRIPDLILKKRDKGELTKEEIDFFIKSVCDVNNNSIQESQIGAMLMAIFYSSMTYEESFYLTESMMRSGSRFEWPNFKNSVVDKHSTGGVGDKISLPLAPALAACGLKVPMISGRGLGFTGGTLDKLESIPGYLVTWPKDDVGRFMETVGCCIVGQSAEINPADRVLYATRDITSTVDCIPLIAGSIVSKKAIEDLDCLVLDVKLGRAAFMKTPKEARQLADYMLQICKRLNLKAGVFLTRHDNPIGTTIGNQLEIEETIDCLHGIMANDVQELVTKYGGYLLMRTGHAQTLEEGTKMIMEKLTNGQALEKFRQMIIAQGVSENIAEELCINRNYEKVFEKRAKFVTKLVAQKEGYIQSIDALDLGVIGSKLGAGRSKAGDKISYEVGFRLIKRVGDYVKKDEPWLQIEHNCDKFDSIYSQPLNQSIKIEREFTGQTESSIVEIID